MPLLPQFAFRRGRQSLRILNHTPYTTRTLGMIARRVVNDYIDDPAKRASLCVVFDPVVRKGRSRATAAVTGGAWVGKARVTVLLPSNSSGVPNSREVAFVVAHEIHHCLGWRHARSIFPGPVMRGTWLSSSGPRGNAERFAWADDPRYAIAFKAGGETATTASSVGVGFMNPAVSPAPAPATVIEKTTQRLRTDAEVQVLSLVESRVRQPASRKDLILARIILAQIKAEQPIGSRQRPRA